MPLLTVKDLAFSYVPDTRVFEDVALQLEPGEVLTLLGPNGSGKSTLLNCVAGLVNPEAGEILLDGQPISTLSPRQLASRIAYVPQHIQTTYSYPVRDYLVMGTAPNLNMLQTPGEQEYAQVDRAIEALNLADLEMRSVSQLSGGERQRVAIARAIVQEPQLILFDEPTSALDFGNQIRVLRTIQQLAESGYAVIMTTHNPDQPILLGGKVALLNSNGTLLLGNAAEILTSERLSALYGTSLHVVNIDEIGRLACVCATL